MNKEVIAQVLQYFPQKAAIYKMLSYDTNVKMWSHRGQVSSHPF
jgi:hypothetical protein